MRVFYHIQPLPGNEILSQKRTFCIFVTNFIVADSVTISNKHKYCDKTMTSPICKCVHRICSANFPAECEPPRCGNKCAGRRSHSQNNNGASWPDYRPDMRQSPVNKGGNNNAPPGAFWIEETENPAPDDPPPSLSGALLKNGETEIQREH